MPVIQAQDIVNAAIQDSQIQTTNRVALYDYVDRINQRILRESQWRFLLSDPETFITMPGVGAYTLVSGSAPAGAFQTNLQLTDFANIAPGTVFNLTSWTKIDEDADDSTTLNYFLQRDGSLRAGYPRTYSNLISNPGTIVLKPVPDNQNLYYPVPETPVVTSAPVSGCALSARLYYGVITYVDSLGGESTQCNIPFSIVVPAGSVLTVHSPGYPPGGGISGNQTAYRNWNIYLGLAIGEYNLQNLLPIPIGTNWVEPITGYSPFVTVPTSFPLYPGSDGMFLSINELGFLTTTDTGSGLPLPASEEILNSNGLWFVTTDSSSGFFQITPVTTIGTPPTFPYILLRSTDGDSIWKITVGSGGNLLSTVVTFQEAIIPPASTTIQPINAYVIQFRYYKTRNQITGPTDVLQIPYAYKDIVISGVNYLAALYIDMAANREPTAKTMIYKRDFDQGLSQIRRDLRINFRKTDFIGPDITSQYVVGNQQGIPTMGW